MLTVVLCISPYLVNTAGIYILAMNKRPNPDNNTPPKSSKEKKSKSGDTEDTDKLICDRCSVGVDQLVQCERCDMWLCTSCEGVPPEVINMIGNYSELRIHWFCKHCDELALKAIRNLMLLICHLKPPTQSPLTHHLSLQT